MFSWLSGNESMEWRYDDLKTPINNDDYDKFYNESLKFGKEWLDSFSWNITKTNDNVVMEEMIIPNSDISAVRVSTTVNNMSLDKIKHIIFSSSLEEKKKLSPDLMKYDSVKNINENMSIMHLQYSAPLTITNREFIYIKTLHQLDNNKYLVVVRSINYERLPFSSGFVRGVIKSCYYAELLEDGKIKLMSMTHVDPKGWIPTSIINSFKEKEIDRLLKIPLMFGN